MSPDVALMVIHITQAEPRSVNKGIPDKLHGNIPDDFRISVAQKAQQLYEIQSRKGGYIQKQMVK